MFDPTTVIAAAALIGIAIVAAALLHGWQGWLALKRLEIASPGETVGGGVPTALGGARIEIADLKERIRKLEAIAAGVDL